MPEDRAANIPIEHAGDDVGRRGIGEMPVTGHDPLFGRPRTFGVVLQELFVVIRLDDEGMRLAHAFARKLRGETEISQKAERRPIMMQNESNRIHRVVWNAKSLDRDIPDGEVAASHENAPVLGTLRRLTAQRFGGERVAVDGSVKLSAPHIEPAGMVSVFVREQDAIDLDGVNSACGQALPDLQTAEPTIDEQTGLRRLDERAISRAATAEDGEVKHLRE